MYKKYSRAVDENMKLIKSDAEREMTVKKEALLAAKEAVKSERDRLTEETKERKQEFIKNEEKLLKRENSIDEKLQSIAERENKLAKEQDALAEKDSKLADMIEKEIQELERISGMSVDDAKKLLLDRIKQDLKQEEVQLIRENEIRIKEESDQKAKEILTTVMQRCLIDQVVESTVSVVNLPSDEMKGRIIGREGRNIRTLETLTGVDLIIDDTPEAVVLSCFDPVRREIAKTALEKLIIDGRIHPVKIEETVEKAKAEIEQKIRQEGEHAAMDMGIINLHKELIKTLGRLYYRTSYGQNVLKHSLEVGHIAGMIAAEIGADVHIAKRAGLLHDIGKAVDQTQDGTHIELGVELARKYGEKEDVIHAIAAHHDDVAAETIEAVLVKLADAVSAGRPGSRRDTLEIYIKRLQKLEEIATSYDGIKQSFAVQAGREVRVIVQPEKFDDVASAKLSRDIAKRIEDELDYPGQIRVTVVREVRVTEVAK